MAFTVFIALIPLFGFTQKIQTVEITDDFDYIYPDQGKAFYVEDKQNKMTPDGFFNLYKAGKVTINEIKMPYFDKSNSAWWLGIKFRNVSSGIKRMVVEVDFVYMDNLDFYLWEDGRLVKTVKDFSWKTPSKQRPVPHRVFAVDFETSPEKSYIWAIQIQKKDGYLAVPLRMYEYHAFEHMSKVNYNAHGIAIGIMLLGVVMGLALYLLSKEIMYAYYIGYILSVSGMIVSEQGYLNQYFLSLYHILPTHNTWMYFLASGIICHIRFSLIFLEISRHRNRFWVAAGKTLMYASVALLCAAFIPGASTYIYDFALIAGICFNFLNVAFILIAFKQKHPVAFLYLIAVAPFTICAIYICFSTLGYLPESWLIFEWYKYGPVWEVLVLSVVVCFVYQNTLKLKSAAVLQLIQTRADNLVSINEAQETERQRIARELHDSVGAMLGALRLNMDALKELIRMNEQDKMDGTFNLLDHVTREVRRVSHDLMPASLVRAGLIAALEEIYAANTTPAIRIISDHYGKTPGDAAQEILLLRIIQELVSNTLKHAEASEISIQLIEEEGNIQLIYEDDGKGMDPGKKSQPDGMGLQNINSRVKYLKGTIENQSQPGRGLTCIITFPAATMIHP